MDPLRESVELPGGGRAAYEVIGAGEPLFYFPGGPGYSANLLRDDAELLSDRFAVHLIDPHGSGGSTPPADPSAYDHLGHARFYEAVRRALGIERITVMGISFGSLVALTYSALFPDCAARCIAIAARAVGEDEQGADAEEEMERMLARHAGARWYESARTTWDEWTPRVLAATDAREVDAMMAEVLPFYTAHPEREGVRRLIDAWRTDARSDLAALKAWEGGLFQTIDIRPLLGRVRCPTLLLVGELDLICGPAHSHELARAIPHAQVVTIPDSGHFIPAEAPDEFREAVLSFCAAHPA
jgi:pimeloyl-ACP methyl ester carboxylesterase